MLPRDGTAATAVPVISATLFSINKFTIESSGDVDRLSTLSSGCPPRYLSIQAYREVPPVRFPDPANFLPNPVWRTHFVNTRSSREVTWRRRDPTIWRNMHKITKIEPKT